MCDYLIDLEVIKTNEPNFRYSITAFYIIHTYFRFFIFIRFFNLFVQFNLLINLKCGLNVADRDKLDDDRATSPESIRSSPASSPPPNPLNQSCQPGSSRRFISSILGGEVPYGSKNYLLTRAERKEYAQSSVLISKEPQLPGAAEKVELPRPVTPPKTPRVDPPARVSVIQRVPSQSQNANRDKIKIELSQNPEPEQVINVSLLLSFSSPIVTGFNFGL